MIIKKIKTYRFIVAIFLASVLTLSFVVDTAKVFAIPDVQFYGSNDVLLFDPDAVNCASGGDSGSTTLRGADTREKIWNYLVDKGLSPEQAAGVMGNMAAESGFSPTRRQGSGDLLNSRFENNAWGLAQWDGGRRFTSPDRGILGKLRKDQPDLMKYTASQYGGPGDDKKVPAADLDKILLFELDYLYQESKSRRVTADGFGRAANEWETLKLQKTVTKATVFWHNNFEVSADSEQRVMENRGGAANKAFEDFSSKTGQASSASDSACPSSSGASGDLATLVGKYVWPTYHSPPYANNRKAYQEAQRKAGSGSYKGGGTNGQLGVDCGGFVTRLIIDSGFDPNYNHSGKTSKGAGPTGVQQAWARANWTGLGKGGKSGSSINPADLKPGDVAFSPGHTFVYVGGTGKEGDPKIAVPKAPEDGIMQDTTLGAGDSRWHGVASASISFTGQSWRSPMAGHESLTSSSVTWYRK